MAELLKKKLLFPSTFVRLQAIDQWIAVVRPKLKEGLKCSADLEILWKYCYEPSSVDLGYACANGLIKLVEDNLLNIDDVITMAINYATAAKVVKILVYIVGCLIKFQAVDHVKKTSHAHFNSPYNFGVCPHPFISIMNSTPNSLNVIDSHTAHMILSCEDSYLSTVLAALRDAILYIALKEGNTTVAEFRQSVPEVFKALFVKRSELENDWNGPCDIIMKLIIHILDYYEPNSDNIKYFEEFSSYTTCVAYHTHFMLKLQHCIMKNSSIYDVYLIVQSMSRLLRSDINAGVNLDVIAVGFSLILGGTPLQVLSSVLTVLTEFLDKYHLDLSFVVLSMLKVLLLKLKFLTSTISCGEELSTLLENLLQILTNSMAIERKCNSNVSHHADSSSNIFVLRTYQLHYLIQEVTANKVSRLSWLNGIEKRAVKKEMDSCDVNDVTLVLSTLFIHSLDNFSTSTTSDFANILCGIKEVGLNYPEASYKFLPVLLYSLKSTKDVTTVDVLLTLPNLASHANCVAPVLNVIKGISANSDCNLKAIGIRMLMELWKVQDRCFPYLLEAVYSLEVQTVKKLANNMNIKVVKAAAVALVCKKRPHQHGADMLKLIEIMLNKNPSSTALAYLLEGLYSLCMKTVLDVVTVTEKVLTILQSSTNLVVIRFGLKILALLSDFDGTEANTQTKVDNVIVSIWKLVSSGQPTLVDEALYCLSHFNPQNFQTKHLPSALWPLRSDDIEDEEFLESVVPFSHYLVVAKGANCIGLPGCTKFLTAVLRRELEDMPRGIHHKAMKSQLASTQPKAAKSIPDFVSAIYERNKKPGLRAPLAFSMLLSQSSHRENYENVNSKKLIVTAGRKCMDIVQALLKEVTIEPHNWQDLIRCSQGWVAFMKKCLMTMAIGRRTETEMQKFDDQEEKEHRIKTAVLWCRDKIVNALKAASKNGPSMQGNAILGLVGLLVAISQLDDDEQNVAEDTEYVSMSHFSQMALDTIISIAFSNHIPSGRLLSWCQYRAISSTGKLCTTQVGRICAIHAMPICISSSSQGRHNKVKAILTLFGDDFGDKQLNFHRQISLGNTVSVLIKEQRQSNTDSTVSEFSLKTTYQNMLKNIETFIECPSDSQDVGHLIGWGLAATSRLSQSSTACEREKLVWNKMLEILKTSDISPDTLQTISIVLTWLCLHGCVRGIISSIEAKELLGVLVDCADEIPVKSGFSESLGTLCCGLKLNGNKDVSSTMDKFFTQWFGMVEKGNVPTREKLAALVGLSSLCGASASLFSMPVDPALLTAVQYVSKLSGTVKLLKQLHASSDAGMQSRCPIYLGCLNMFFENNIQNSFILPSTYEYLSKSSLLNGMFNILIDNSVPVNDTALKYLEMSLHCIGKASQDIIMPPVNWSNALNAVLMNAMSSDAARVLLITIILSQCERSLSSSSLLCKCISPDVFNQLPNEARIKICVSFQKIVTAAKEPDLIAFLQMMKESMLSHVDSNLKIAFLTGLEAFLQNSKEQPTSINIEECLKGIFFETDFSVYSSVDLELTTKLAACCKFVEFLPSGDIGPNTRSPLLLRYLHFSCCRSLHRIQLSSLCSKLALACSQVSNISDEATWVIAIYALRMKKLVKFSMLKEWTEELMKLTEEQHSDILQRKDYVEYSVRLVILVLMCVYFENDCPHFEEDVCPGLVAFFNGMCQHTFPVAVHRTRGKQLSGGTNECIVSWSMRMINKLRQSGCSSALLKTLVSTIAMFKNAESSLLPSTWRQIVSTLYRD